jgi:hypothetical protein
MKLDKNWVNFVSGKTFMITKLQTITSALLLLDFVIRLDVFQLNYKHVTY